MVDHESRSEFIARTIAGHIKDAEMKVGDKLPTEAALSEHFGVSRAAVREAVARLKAAGLVETRQGSGSYVRLPDAIQDGLDPATRSSLNSLLDLIRVRKVIEAEMAALAAEMRTPQQLAAIEKAYQRLTEAEQNGQDGVDEDCAFHAAIAEASHNVYWQQLTKSLRPSIAIGVQVTRRNEIQRREYYVAVDKEHEDILKAIRRGDPSAARMAAIRHMNKSEERILTADREFWQDRGAPVKKLGKA